MPTDETTEQAVYLNRLTTRTVEIAITGVTPLIVHRFDEHSRAQMLAAQQGKATKKKAPKDPEAEYNRSRYLLPDGTDGFPAPGFKSAIVNACSHFDGITKVLARQSLFVQGVGPDQLVPIIGEPKMREDTVRIGRGTADLRYRAMYPEWSAILPIEFVDSAITVEAVFALVDAAGLGGIGEWRPSKAETGTYGRFRIDEEFQQ